jgi:hypothetical protein
LPDYPQLLFLFITVFPACELERAINQGPLKAPPHPHPFFLCRFLSALHHFSHFEKNFSVASGLLSRREFFQESPWKGFLSIFF